MRMSFNKKRNRRASQTAESELSNDGKSESLHPYSSIMLGTVGGSYIWCSSCKVCNITAVYYHCSVFLTRIKLTSVAVHGLVYIATICGLKASPLCSISLHVFAHLDQFLCDNITKSHSVVIYNTMLGSVFVQVSVHIYSFSSFFEYAILYNIIASCLHLC